MAADPRRVHDREQRAAQADDFAHVVAAFYAGLKARKVPPQACQALSEAYVSAMADSDTPPEWTV